MTTHSLSAATIEHVQSFWEGSPLFTGESTASPGSREFFEEHRRTLVEDCFAGVFDKRILPPNHNRQAVLDLGCGPGQWVIEFGRLGCDSVTAADLTENALNLTSKRCEIYGVDATFSQQNAEQLTFADNQFSHVNCQGVIHHTPNTAQCVSEIARVLRPGGTANISVYYKNAIIQAWPLFRVPSKLLKLLGGGLKGRGRESIFGEDDVNEIVRLYDGAENPIGKAYSREEFVRMLSPYFEVQELFLHFFPLRALPFQVPKTIHHLLDKHLGFMIYANLVKK